MTARFEYPDKTESSAETSLSPADRYDPLIWHEPSASWLFADVSIPGDIVVAQGDTERAYLRIRTSSIKADWVPLRKACVSDVAVPRGVPTTVVYRDKFYAVTAILALGNEAYEYRLEPWPLDEPIRRTYAYSREAELIRNRKSAPSTVMGLLSDTLLGLPVVLALGRWAESAYCPRQWDFYALFRNGCLLEGSIGGAVLVGVLAWLFEWFSAVAVSDSVVIPLKANVLGLIGLLFVIDSLLRWYKFKTWGIGHALFGTDTLVRSLLCKKKQMSDSSISSRSSTL